MNGASEGWSRVPRRRLLGEYSAGRASGARQQQSATTQHSTRQVGSCRTGGVSALTDPAPTPRMWRGTVGWAAATIGRQAWTLPKPSTGRVQRVPERLEARVPRRPSELGLRLRRVDDRRVGRRLGPGERGRPGRELGDGLERAAGDALGDWDRGETELARDRVRVEHPVADEVVGAGRTLAVDAEEERLAHVVVVHELDRNGRHEARQRHGDLPHETEEALAERRERPGQHVLGPERVRPDDDAGPQEVEVGPLAVERLVRQRLLDLRLLLRVEEVFGRARGMVLGDPDRVVRVEPVGGDGGRVDEPLRAGVLRRAERVERALDVDLTQRVARGVARDVEREVDDDVGAVERLLERLLVANVPLAVLHLVPALRARDERATGDPDDLPHAVVVLEERDEAGPEGAGGAGDGDGERRHGGSLTRSRREVAPRSRCVFVRPGPR